MAVFLAGCAYKEPAVTEEQAERPKETSEIPYDEPLPEDYKGTLSMWGWDNDYYQTITGAFQEKYPVASQLESSSADESPWAAPPHQRD